MTCIQRETIADLAQFGEAARPQPGFDIQDVLPAELLDGMMARVQTLDVIARLRKRAAPPFAPAGYSTAISSVCVPALVSASHVLDVRAPAVSGVQEINAARS